LVAVPDEMDYALGEAAVGAACASSRWYDGRMVRLNIESAALAEFCRRNQIRRLSLFGSTLRAENRPDSDIDLLVEFRPDASVGFIRLAGMENALSRLLGSKVDLRTPAELSPYFRDEVLATAETLYAEG
jgi:predicted nucleotidyltransferase